MSEQMESGKFLDAKIAEKVFGKKNFDLPSDRPITATELGERDIRLALLSNYSTDIRFAWEVVEKMKQFEIRGKYVWGAFCDELAGEDGYFADGFANVNPHSICLAALKAVSP